MGWVLDGMGGGLVGGVGVCLMWEITLDRWREWLGSQCMSVIQGQIHQYLSETLIIVLTHVALGGIGTAMGDW